MDVFEEKVNPVVELGLVLFQVGTGVALDYGNGEAGFEGALKEAQLGMHRLATRCGPVFSDLITSVSRPRSS